METPDFQKNQLQLKPYTKKNRFTMRHRPSLLETPRMKIDITKCFALLCSKVSLPAQDSPVVGASHLLSFDVQLTIL